MKSTLILSSIFILFFSNAAIANKVKVRAEIIKNREFSEQFNAIGQIRYGNSRSYNAASSGYVDFITDKSSVKSGDVVIAVNYKLARTMLNGAKEEANFTKIQLERDKKLLKKKVVTQEIVEQSQIKFDAAKLKLADAENYYRNNVITATFDAQVNPIKLKKGDMVNVGDFLCKIVQKNSAPEVTAHLPEKLLNKIKIGSKAKIHSGDVVTTGVIQSAGESAQINSSFPVKIKILEEDAMLEKLTDGQYADIKIIYNKQKTLSVPTKSLMLSDLGNFIYKISENNTAKKLYVEIGIRNDDYSSVISGDISSGDRVITEGMTKIQDNQEIIQIPEE